MVLAAAPIGVSTQYISVYLSISHRQPIISQSQYIIHQISHKPEADAVKDTEPEADAVKDTKPEADASISY